MSTFFTNDTRKNTFNIIEEITYNDLYKELFNDFRTNSDADINPVTLANKEFPLNQLVFKPEHSKQVKELTKEYHNANAHSQSTAHNIINSDQTLAITKVDAGLSITDCLPIIKGIREELKDDLFGVILRKAGGKVNDPNGSFNPLNPLVASAIKDAIDNGEERSLLENKYSIIIYSLIKNIRGRRREAIDALETKKDFSKDIENLMITPNLSRGLSILYTDTRKPNLYTASVNEILKDRNGNTVRPESQYSIVPIQIANSSGIMYPAYGAVFFNGTSAMNMTPFKSANVGNPSGTGQTWSNVCTGSLNSSTDKGKASLNHSNNTSPLNTRNIGKGAIEWAHQCIDMSLQLLLGEEVSVESEPEVPKRMTMAQYRTMYPDATTKNYIEYIRELNAKELLEW